MRRAALLAAVALLTTPAAAETGRAHSRAARPPAPDRGRLLALAHSALEAGRPEEAARLLRSAARRFQSVQALLQLARLQAGQKDAAGAFESLRRALAIAPNSEGVRSAYAQLSLAAHTPLPAILALEPLTRICPTVAQYHYWLGLAFMQAGDMSAAVEALQQAERLEPDRALTLIALGLALNNRKLYADARPYLLRSLEREPDNVEAAAALAESEEGLGDLEQAQALAQRALAKVSDHPTASLVRGLVLMRQERYAEARDAFQMAVAADPRSSKAHYQLSLAYARLHDDANSQKHRELYQRTLKEIEEQVIQLRNRRDPFRGTRP